MSRFLQSLKLQGFNPNYKIGFNEINDKRIIQAVSEIKIKGIANPVLIGNTAKIKANAKRWEFSIEGITIIDPETFPDHEKLVEKFYHLRKDKGVMPADAAKYLQDESYFATMLLKMDYVDALIGGATHTTADVFRPAFQIIKTKPHTKIASSYFIMHNDEETMLFADGSINIDPNAKELAEIAIMTNDTAKKIGLHPRVALLSFSTHHSAEHPILNKVREALKIVKKKRPDILIDGEIQFDAAYDPHAAKIKAKDSPVAGKANVFVFPELNSSNIGYKIAKLLGGYKAIGPIVQGLDKHVNDLSRGCNTEEIIELAQITVLIDKKEKNIKQN